MSLLSHPHLSSGDGDKRSSPKRKLYEHLVCSSRMNFSPHLYYPRDDRGLSILQTNLCVATPCWEASSKSHSPILFFILIRGAKQFSKTKKP
ncbi:hypothetical protein AVEN_275101-1 [Araneus ventricosus]|uniref:Uncharacterized protein n=1 Tax=Araneus ventricosus TaxID=182803 RepID=A0A4Y2VC53_ARAVE|nr:hypothetical protein AVEN_275101-1 [Araneus ventricosus]